MKIRGRALNREMQNLLRHKFKLVVSVATILMVLVTATALMLLAGPRSSFAIEVDSGDHCGLRVNVTREFDEIDNLNPGDSKSSTMEAKNTKTTVLEYYFHIFDRGGTAGIYRLDALKEKDGYGTDPLCDVLLFTVKRDGLTLFHGLISEFMEQFGDDGIYMGALVGNESHQIDISIHFPLEAGNEYQGSRASVQFKFRSDCNGKNGAALEVRKFRDSNRNGTWDGGEPEIRNWKVYIDGVEYKTPVESLALEPGTYTVREETRSGWTPSTPTEVSVTLKEGEHKTVWFGNYPRSENGNGNGNGNGGAALIVQKFNDLNGDGTWNGGEPEIEGWPVTINGREYKTPVTLFNLSPGTYTIVEQTREGWTATKDTEVSVTLADGERKTVRFGNTRDGDNGENGEKGTLTVRKFHDFDGDGIWDEDEPEIAGWIVTINGHEYETPVNLAVEPGTYTVTEKQLSGWMPTTPVTVSVTLGAGVSQVVLFGNEETESIIIIPPDTPELPRTGELPPFYYYGAGVLLALSGILLGKKHFPSKRR